MQKRAVDSRLDNCLWGLLLEVWPHEEDRRWNQMPIGRQVVTQQVTKRTARATKGLAAKKRKILDWPMESPDLNPFEHAFCLLKRTPKAKSSKIKQELKIATVQAWLSITREDIWWYMSRASSIPRKGYATKYYEWLLYSTLLNCPIFFFNALKRRGGLCTKGYTNWSWCSALQPHCPFKLSPETK